MSSSNEIVLVQPMAVETKVIERIVQASVAKLTGLAQQKTNLRRRHINIHVAIDFTGQGVTAFLYNEGGEIVSCHTDLRGNTQSE